MSRDNTVIYELLHFPFSNPKRTVPSKAKEKSSLYNATMRQKDCVCSGEIKGAKLGIFSPQLTMLYPPKLSPLAAVSKAEKGKPGRNFSLPGVFFSL